MTDRHNTSKARPY